MCTELAPQSGDLDRCYRCLTDSLTTLKDRATHYSAPYKYKSGPLVTQKCNDWNLNKYDENFIGN